MPSPEVILNAVGYGLLLPAAVTVVALLLLLRLGGGEPLALGAGLAAGFVALSKTGQIKDDFFHPEESWDWLPALGLLAAIAATVEQLAERWRIVRWAVRLLVSGLTAGLLVRAQSERDPFALGSYPALAASALQLGLAILLLWGLLDLSARRRPSAVAPVLLAFSALSAAILGELAGFSTVAHLGSVVAGTLGGWALVAWRWPQTRVVRAGISVVSVLLPGLLFVTSNNSYSDVPSASYLLIFAAPLLLAAATFLPFSDRHPRWRALCQAGATLLPLAAGLALAARS
jgi:hypothetical protein